MLPRVPGTRIHAGVFLSPVLAAAAGLALEKTVPGFFARAVGLNPLAARASGIPARSITLAAASVSGMLCGVAGAAEVAGVTGRVFENFSGGYGYTAIAAALLARLHPGGLMASALFFGALGAGASWTQRTLGIPSVTLFVVQAVVIGAAALAAREPR
jgi:simple sugar transport system permease protein